MSTRNVDRRSDIWSVGVVIYEALTGEKPFDAETMGGLAVKIHTAPLPAPTSTAPDLPPALDAWFERACARNLDERYDSASALAAGLATAIGVDVPKSLAAAIPAKPAQTGPRRTPMLAAGAATDAGVVRGSATAQRITKSRIMLLAAVVVAGAFVGFVGLRIFASSSSVTPAGLVDTAPSATTVAAPPTPTSTATPTSTSASTSVTPLASVAPNASVRSPGTGRSTDTSTGPEGTPVTSPPPSRLKSPRPHPTLPPAASTARPASTGHDIF
jgi:serine/threonine-protein kinase